MPKLADRVKETTTTTGTGTYNLAGAATGFRAFSAAFATADTVYYCVEDETDWEVGIGTLTTGTPWTLARTTILASSNAGAAVSWAAGSRNVFCTAAAAVFPAGNAAQNILINGNFSVNQRGVTSAADDVYCLDRWFVLTETGSVTVTQQTLQENGTPTNIRLTQPDASPKQIALAQIVEAANCRHLRGKDATLGVRVRNSDGGQINYAVLEWSGTLDAVTSDVISAWAGTPTYIGSVTERAKGTLTPSANTWTDMPALTAAINSATNNVIVLIWSNADMAQNATLDIARARLVDGDVLPPFAPRDTGSELELCQRYYYRLNGNGTGHFANAFSAITNSTGYATLHFPVEMRIAPTALEQSGTASHYAIFFSNSVVACSGVPGYNGSTKQTTQISWSASSGHTAGQAGSIYGSASAYLGWSAEL